MHHSPRSPQARHIPTGARPTAGHVRPAVVDALVERGLQDPSLLTARREPTYADFLVAVD